MVLVDSCIAKAVVAVPAIYLFLQSIFSLSVLIELIHPVESCTGTTEGVAQEQESSRCFKVALSLEGGKNNYDMTNRQWPNYTTIALIFYQY